MALALFQICIGTLQIYIPQKYFWKHWEDSYFKSDAGSVDLYFQYDHKAIFMGPPTDVQVQNIILDSITCANLLLMTPPPHQTANVVWRS